MRKLIAAAAIALVAVSTAAGQDRRHEGWLHDGAGLLAAEEAAVIRSSIATTREKTGVTVAVLTLKESGGSEPKAIAVDTLNAWNPGPRSVILLVVVSPRKLYVQPGTELVPTFGPEACTALLRESVVPEMKAGRHFAAIRAGITAIQARFVPTETAQPAPDPVAAPSSVPSPPTAPAAVQETPPSGSSAGAVAGVVAMIVVIGGAVAWVLGPVDDGRDRGLSTVAEPRATTSPTSWPVPTPQAYAPPPPPAPAPRATRPTYSQPPPAPKRKKRSSGGGSSSSSRSSSDDSGSFFSWGSGGDSGSSFFSSFGGGDSGGSSSSCDGGGGGGSDY